MMRVVGECFFWYRLTRVFPDKFHRAVKRLCVCVLFHHVLYCVPLRYLVEWVLTEFASPKITDCKDVSQSLRFLVVDLIIVACEVDVIDSHGIY